MCFGFVGASASPAPAQDAFDASSGVARDVEGRITVQAVRLDTPLIVNGRLDDEVYKTVPPARGFTQQEPREGEPATEDTQVWVFFDEANLYISARCWDSQPSRMVSYEMRRDHRDILDNENFTVVIDTFQDRRSGYYFQTNPLSALRDQQVTDERTNNNDWNTVWDVKSARDERGWTLEMVIPFKSMRYAGGGPQTWGINFRRMVRWKNEVSFLSPIPASYANRGIYKFSSAANLAGIELPPQSRNFELKPYAKGGLTTDLPANRSNDLTDAVGFDAKYGLTNSVIADFTVNTDFAQVEDDEQQVNLTRFSLFFPEKREFFLEGQGIFAFGGGRQGMGGGGFNGPVMGGGSAPSLMPMMFFSRRIGLSEGREVPIRAGGRVTGRAGPYTIGLLNIQTGATDDAGGDPTNFSVVRVKRDLFRRSAIGVMGTQRSARQDEAGVSQLFGLDASFGLFENLTIDSYYARSRTPDPDGDPSSYLAKVDYVGDRYGLNFEHLSVGDGFRPEVGFLRRDSFRRTYGSTRFSPRPRASRRVRKLSWEASLDYITDPGGRLESREATGSFRVDLNNGDQFSSELARNYELLEAPFAIATGVSIAPGSYAFQELRTQYYLGPQRTLSGRVNVNHGSFYDGNRTEAGLGGRLDLGSRVGVEPRLTINWVDLQAGSFVSKLVSSRVSLTLSPRMAVASLVQFNSSTSSLSSNVRFRWEYQPGSDLFVVYNDGRSTRLPGFPALENRTFVVKFTRLFRM